MKYSYNLDRKEIVFASTKDINASFKDLCAVCDAVRYRRVQSAIRLLESVENEGTAIEYRRHNKYMGSRHELGGKKGRYPIKCAAIIRKVIINASANARNKGEDPESMYVVHALANKTIEVGRLPPKGVRAVGGSRPSRRMSSLEFAKIEIGIAPKGAKGLSDKMKRAISAVDKIEAKTKVPAKVQQKPAAKPKQQAKPLKPPEVPTPKTEPKPKAEPQKSEQKIMTEAQKENRAEAKSGDNKNKADSSATSENKV